MENLEKNCTLVSNSSSFCCFWTESSLHARRFWGKASPWVCVNCTVGEEGENMILPNWVFGRNRNCWSLLGGLKFLVVSLADGLGTWVQVQGEALSDKLHLSNIITKLCNLYQSYKHQKFGWYICICECIYICMKKTRNISNHCREQCWDILTVALGKTHWKPPD